MKILTRVAVLVLFAFIVQVCTTQKTEKELVQSTFENFDVNYADNQIDATEGKTLSFDNGSEVIIPANAFVDRNGNVIEGKVDLQYREFHSIADVIASGIPMQYDSAGTVYHFESAGMFEIRASQSGEPVFVADGKEIEVNMASYREGNYNFYYLDEGNEEISLYAPFISPALAQSRPDGGRWALLAQGQQAQANQEKEEEIAGLEEELAEILPEKPIQPKSINEVEAPFEFDVDLNEFPELKSFEGIFWTYAGDPENTPADPNQNDWIFQENWTDVKLKYHDRDKVQYKLILSNNRRTFESIVSPVLGGMSYEAAKKVFKDKMKEYKKVQKQEADRIAKIERRKEFYTQQANFKRSFRIQKMGIYNWDIVIKQPDAIMVNASFTIDRQKPQTAQMAVYLVQADKVITYDIKDESIRVDRFYFSKDARNKIIAVLPGDKVATLSADEFALLTSNNVETGQNLNFDLKMVSQKVSSVKELDQLIQAL